MLRKEENNLDHNPFADRALAWPIDAWPVQPPLPIILRDKLNYLFPRLQIMTPFCLFEAKSFTLDSQQTFLNLAGRNQKNGRLRFEINLPPEFIALNDKVLLSHLVTTPMPDCLAFLQNYAGVDRFNASCASLDNERYMLQIEGFNHQRRFSFVYLSDSLEDVSTALYRLKKAQIPINQLGYA